MTNYDNIITEFINDIKFKSIKVYRVNQVHYTIIWKHYVFSIYPAAVFMYNIYIYNIDLDFDDNDDSRYLYKIYKKDNIKNKHDPSIIFNIFHTPAPPSLKYEFYNSEILLIKKHIRKYKINNIFN
jgi:hypothetical protein